ncbi:MAG: ATP-binding protein [Desulfobulbaceae bacterium]|nr:ATP-binding protein [Desulfobulbaceae bacterium]
MKLNMKINKIKSIDHLEMDLPIEKGLYAITGQNGSGKSTVATCASSVFFNMPMNDYFGVSHKDANISFKLDDATRAWGKVDNRWRKQSSGRMSIKGFYGYIRVSQTAIRPKSPCIEPLSAILECMEFCRNLTRNIEVSNG